MEDHEQGLSDVIALLLIAFLIVLVALFIVAALTGVLSGFLQKSALVAVTASEYTGTPNHIISIYHKQGDPVNLDGTSQTRGVSPVSMILVTPGGSSVQVHPIGTINTQAWSPGDFLYIYPDAGGYGFSDEVPAAPPAFPATGKYTIKITDTKASLLLHSLDVTLS